MAKSRSGFMSILKRLFAGRAATEPERSFALNQLDLKLKPYLGFRNGFFVEAGANDGLDQSNTLLYEKYYGWTGLLIEPIPELAARCRRNRPRCIVENCGLVSFDYPQASVSMRYCNLMSLVKGAMKSEEAEQQHIQTGCAVQKISSYEFTAPAKTLTAVLDQHRVQGIDFFSLDVEGYEIEVLKGLDFDRYRPKFLLIEARFRQEIDALLGPRYEAVATLSHHDVLYRSKAA
jgi:FkbM family methyltransferase